MLGGHAGSGCPFVSLRHCASMATVTTWLGWALRAGGGPGLIFAQGGGATHGKAARHPREKDKGPLQCWRRPCREEFSGIPGLPAQVEAASRGALGCCAPVGTRSSTSSITVHCQPVEAEHDLCATRQPVVASRSRVLDLGPPRHAPGLVAALAGGTTVPTRVPDPDPRPDPVEPGRDMEPWSELEPEPQPQPQPASGVGLETGGRPRSAGSSRPIRRATDAVEAAHRHPAEVAVVASKGQGLAGQQQPQQERRRRRPTQQSPLPAHGPSTRVRYHVDARPRRPVERQWQRNALRGEAWLSRTASLGGHPSQQHSEQIGMAGGGQSGAPRAAWKEHYHHHPHPRWDGSTLVSDDRHANVLRRGSRPASALA